MPIGVFIRCRAPAVEAGEELEASILSIEILAIQHELFLVLLKQVSLSNFVCAAYLDINRDLS